MEYRNFDECLNFIEELMIKHGPFDGLMGFSQVPFHLFCYIIINLIIIL